MPKNCSMCDGLGIYDDSRTCEYCDGTGEDES